jgi:hypothetical protein
LYQEDIASQVDLAALFSMARQIKIGADERRATQRGQNATGLAGFAGDGLLHRPPDLSSVRPLLDQLSRKRTNEVAVCLEGL